MKTGFIGLGHMGSAMAANLVHAGHDVTVFNRSPDKLRALLDLGAREATSIADACQGEVVITMLADDTALSQVALAKGGIVSCRTALRHRAGIRPAGLGSSGYKDIRLALSAAENLHVPMPLGSLLRDRFLRLLAQGGDNLDWADADYVEPLDMLAELREDNQAFAARLRETHELCDEYRDVATASLLEVWIDETERRIWFLFEASRR